MGWVVSVSPPRCSSSLASNYCGGGVVSVSPPRCSSSLASYYCGGGGGGCKCISSQVLQFTGFLLLWGVVSVSPPRLPVHWLLTTGGGGGVVSVSPQRYASSLASYYCGGGGGCKCISSQISQSTGVLLLWGEGL